MDDSRQSPAPSPVESPAKCPAMAPAYLVVLALAAAGGVLILHHAAGAWQDGRTAQSFPPELRRHVAFAVLFNLGLAGATLLALLGEIVATVVRLVRRRVPVRILGRLVVACIPLAVLVGGHRLANPWLVDLMRAVRNATSSEAPPATE